MRNRVPKQLPVPDFEPVPRQYRHDGWTPERQRAFIAALAETGSVKHAAERINMAWRGAYYLRCQPGADSFRAAWEAALDHGVQNLVGIAFERATEGVPIPIFYKGEQCGEKRWYNDRLLMFLLKHHLPGKYGTPALALGTRSRETIEREAAENCPVCRERAEAESAAEAEIAASAQPDSEYAEMLDAIFDRYRKKVLAERRHRLAGEIVAADYTLRQLTYIELVLDCGGRAQAMIDECTSKPSPGGGKEKIYASPISRHLDVLRRAVWEELGDPPRPPLPLDERRPGMSVLTGPTIDDRHRARRAAERRMAEAQAEWEAAATEEGWEKWKAGR